MYCEELENVDTSEYANYQFSKKYIRNKENLIKRQGRIYYPLIKTTGRKIVSAIVAAALMGTMTVAAYEPARNAVKNFFIRIFKGYSVVTVSTDSESEEEDHHKSTIEKQYNITVPDDFILDENETIVTDTHIGLSYYTKDKSKCLYFDQYTSDAYVSSFDNEQSDIIKQEDKYGNEILIYNNNDENVIIVWDNGEYIFELSGNITTEKIMEIYYTIK
jgi:hypothetical protein